jgi:TPP-dependent pyruvate/acetoin dehydrogenase alpha subunit
MQEYALDAQPNVGEEDRRFEFLQTMVRIRAFEERVHRMYLEQQLYGMSPHLSIGEEAMAVGVCGALRKDDYLLGTHRSHGHILAKGAKMRPMLAEICGKSSGYCKGRGGTMHIADFSLGIVGANGIVGGGIPIASGVGLSIKYRSTDQVCVCFFGDAATNIGAFHESVNFACAFKLPVLFVCENNMYGFSTAYKKVSATPDVADRALGYKMPGVIVDGMDVLDVYKAAKEAVARARSGNGPTLIEGKTYRYLGHSASDQRPYRTREEEEYWKARSPIIILRKSMMEEGILAEEDFKKMELAAQAEAEDAANYAISSPEPDKDSLMDFIY